MYGAVDTRVINDLCIGVLGVARSADYDHRVERLSYRILQTAHTNDVSDRKSAVCNRDIPYWSGESIPISFNWFFSGMKSVYI